MGLQRNKGGKKLKDAFGELDLETPRDRNVTFEPKIVPKPQTPFAGFDDKIRSMYARGRATRDIQWHRQKVYKVEASPAPVSTATGAAKDEVRAWQSRTREPAYPDRLLQRARLNVECDACPRGSSDAAVFQLNLYHLEMLDIGTWRRWRSILESFL